MRITADSQSHYVTKQRTPRLWFMNGRPDIATVALNMKSIETYSSGPAFLMRRLRDYVACMKECGSTPIRLGTMSTRHYGMIRIWLLNRGLFESCTLPATHQDPVHLSVKLTALLLRAIAY